MVVWHRATTGHPEHRVRRGAGNQTAEARGGVGGRPPAQNDDEV
jgi:hypothetical protein